MSAEFNEQEYVALLKRLDRTELLIFEFGVRGLAEKYLTMEEFEQRTTELVERHRAGHELRLSDLDCLVGAAA